MDYSQFLEQAKQMLNEMYHSTRWSDVNMPINSKIRDIGERINSSELMFEVRQNEDFSLLLDILDSYEIALNDDWFPYEIIGLEINRAKQLLENLLNDFDGIKLGDWNITIKRIYQKLNPR